MHSLIESHIRISCGMFWQIEKYGYLSTENAKCCCQSDILFGKALTRLGWSSSYLVGWNSVFIGMCNARNLPFFSVTEYLVACCKAWFHWCGKHHCICKQIFLRDKNFLYSISSTRQNRHDRRWAILRNPEHGYWKSHRSQMLQFDAEYKRRQWYRFLNVAKPFWGESCVWRKNLWAKEKSSSAPMYCI